MTFTLVLSCLCLGASLFRYLPFAHTQAEIRKNYIKHDDLSYLEQARFALSRHDYLNGRKYLHKSLQSSEQENDHDDARFLLGIMDIYGWGQHKDIATALETLQPLIEAEDQRALVEVGVVHSKPGTEWSDTDRALMLFMIAAQDNNVFAERNLGIIYAQGYPDKSAGPCWDEAEYWFRRSRSHGLSEASFALALSQLQRYGESALDTEILALLEEAAQDKFPPALLLLGSLYWHHPLLKDTRDQAGEFFLTGAKNNSAECAYHYSLWLEQFSDREQESRKWLEQSASHGFDQAQFLLGLRMEQENTNEHLRRSAVSWFEKAAEQGHARACNRLGLIHYRGLYGYEIDKNKALEYFEVAAEKNLAEAQNNLALTMIYDQKCDQPIWERACSWIEKSASQGYAPAIKNLQKIRAYQANQQKHQAVS